jgi:hypothetical protein
VIGDSVAAYAVVMLKNLRGEQPERQLPVLQACGTGEAETRDGIPAALNHPPTLYPWATCTPRLR